MCRTTTILFETFPKRKKKCGEKENRNLIDLFGVNKTVYALIFLPDEKFSAKYCCLELVGLLKEEYELVAFVERSEGTFV